MGKRFFLILALPWMLSAQPPRGIGFWWDGRIAKDLNLSDEQSRQIYATVGEYRSRVFDLRQTVDKAEADLEQAFNEDPVDQRKANDAIERLAAARADLTRTLSQMTLKMRSVLTAQQWQDLRKRQPTWPNRQGGRRHGPPGSGKPTSQEQQK